MAEQYVLFDLLGFLATFSTRFIGGIQSLSDEITD